MIFDVSYWTRVFKRILYVVFILLGLYIGLKLSVFYMPFLVAFIISLMVEPAIKFIMRKTNLTRRTSSIIIFVIVSLIILGTLTWLIITLFSESSSLLQGLNNYFDKAYIQFQSLISTFNYDKIHLSSEVLSVIENSTEDLLTTASNWLRGALTGLINFITSLPSIAICIGITVVALYFICVDKIYILDQIEYHLPKVWVKKIRDHLKDLEPKLVSKNIGIHPIFTLIAMYTGFKVIGVMGLLIGPIVLIIFKNIFANLIDKGVFKTIFDRK